MQTSDWRDGRGGGAPRFDRKTRAWFERRVAAILFTRPLNKPRDYWDGKNSWDDYSVGLLTAWYLERREWLVQWHDDETYRGRGYSCGEWRINEALVKALRVHAVAHVDRTLDAEACETLDDWLRADIDGTLWHAGEAGGMAQVAKVGLASNVLPRRTCGCGKRFRPDKRNARKCDACRELARRRQEERIAARRNSAIDSDRTG